MPTQDSSTLFRALLVLYYVGQASILVPVAVGLLCRQWLTPALRAMLQCCLMWMVLMALGEYASKVWHYNVAVYATASILEMWFIGLAFYHTLRFSLRRQFLPIGITYTAFGLLDIFVLHGLWRLNTYTMVLNSALIITLTLFYFEQTLRELRNITLEREPMFVVSVALLLYYAGTVVMFIIRSNRTDPTEYLIIGSINSIFNLVMHCLLARAFWLAGRAQHMDLGHDIATHSRIRA
jgi:hypothetical protein